MTRRGWTSETGGEQVPFDGLHNVWDLASGSLPKQLWVQATNPGETNLTLAVYDAVDVLMGSNMVMLTAIQYYGNSGVYIFNQYEVQILDANSYSNPNGGQISSTGPLNVGGNLKVDPGLLANPTWQQRFPNPPQLLSESKGTDKKTGQPNRDVAIPVDTCVPGALYGTASNFVKKNPGKANTPTQQKNWSVATGGWNTLEIRFWAATKNPDGTIATPANIGTRRASPGRSTFSRCKGKWRSSPLRCGSISTAWKSGRHGYAALRV